MLAVVPSRERSGRGTEILSSAWTGGTFFIIIIIIPHRGVAAQGTEPPTPPLPQPGPHLPALEGSEHGVQPRDVVLVHAGHVAGAVQPGSVAHQQLSEAKLGSAPSHLPLPVSPRAPHSHSCNHR